ncbi:MAG: hypothetical protein ACFFE7_13695 [Candidatus Thorarchaeota archaeon]
MDYRRTAFPSSCPVCGEPTTTDGTILALSKQQRDEAQRISRGPFPSSRVVASMRAIPDFSSPTYLTIPSCERHALSFEDTKRVRPTLTALNGLFMLVTVFLVFILVSTYLIAQAIDLRLLFMIGLMCLGTFLTYVVSRPSALERAVSVYDMQSDMSMVVLRVANLEYAEELLRLNPMTATLYRLEKAPT